MSGDRMSGLNRHNKTLNNTLRESMQEALVLLLKEKSYADITISEICRKAGFSRTGFYSNYSSKDDVFYRVLYSALDEITTRLGSPFSKKLSIEWYENVFKIIKDNADFFSLVSKEDYYGMFYSSFNKIIMEQNDFGEKERYSRLIWGGGFLNIVIFWLNSGMTEPVGNLAEYCHKKLSPILL